VPLVLGNHAGKHLEQYVNTLDHTTAAKASCSRKGVFCRDWWCKLCII